LSLARIVQLEGSRPGWNVVLTGVAENQGNSGCIRWRGSKPMGLPYPAGPTYSLFNTSSFQDQRRWSYFFTVWNCREGPKWAQNWATAELLCSS